MNEQIIHIYKKAYEICYRWGFHNFERHNMLNLPLHMTVGYMVNSNINIKRWNVILQKKIFFQIKLLYSECNVWLSYLHFSDGQPCLSERNYMCSVITWNVRCSALIFFINSFFFITIANTRFLLKKTFYAEFK